MRLFVALDIDEVIRQRMHRFVEGVRGFAPDVRFAGSESFHLTLKFIGEQPPEMMERIKSALAAVRAEPIEITFQGYGFFPTPKAARVFWIGTEAVSGLSALASAVDDSLTALGIEKERHAFSPHLTLARAGSGNPRGRAQSHSSVARFRHLQEKLAALPPPTFGTMTAREFFLYQSRLSPRGAQYAKLERFPLG